MTTAQNLGDVMAFWAGLCAKIWARPGASDFAPGGLRKSREILHMLRRRFSSRGRQKSVVVLCRAVLFSQALGLIASCTSSTGPLQTSDLDTDLDIGNPSGIATQAGCHQPISADSASTLPHVPDWFASSTGHQRRLAVIYHTACAVGQSGIVSCWGHEDITGVAPARQTSHLDPVLVDVIQLPLNDIVDISFMEPGYGLFLLLVDSEGQVWGWETHPFQDYCPISPGQGQQSPCVIDLGAKAWQAAPGWVGGGTLATVVARVEPGIINGTGDFWPLLGKPDRYRWNRKESAIHTVPEIIPNVSDFVQINGGSGYFCGLRSNRQVICWGVSLPGFPHHGDWCRGVSHLAPAEVPSLDDTVFLANGEGASCAVKSDRTLWCWGHWGPKYELPACDETDVSVPRLVPCVTDAVAVTSPSDGFVCVLHGNGDVTCVHASHGTSKVQMADASDIYPRTWPGAKVPGLPEPVKEIASYWDCACAITQSEAVYCWGRSSCLGPASAGVWSDTALFVTQLE